MKKGMAPDWLFIDKDTSDFYKKLTSNKLSIFDGREFWEVFIFAMALGYYEGYKKPLKKRVKTIPLSTIRNNDKIIWLIKSIAISEKGLDILMDEKEIYKIAEEFANGGIKLLYEKIFEIHAGDLEKKLEFKANKILEK